MANTTNTVTANTATANAATTNVEMTNVGTTNTGATTDTANTTTTKQNKRFVCKHTSCKQVDRTRANFTTKQNLIKHEFNAELNPCCTQTQKCQAGSTLEETGNFLRFPPEGRYKCRHTSPAVKCTATFNRTDSQRRHEKKIHKTPCLSHCERCHSIKQHNINKDLRNKPEKQSCNPCDTHQLPPLQKLNETNVARGLAALQKDLHNNPNKPFDYSITHTLIYPSTSSTRFVVDVPNDPAQPTRVIPLEALTSEYKAAREKIDKEANLLYLNSKFLLRDVKVW
jgi:hypothetical protein